jgi:tryptophan synthase alpha chain
MSNSKITKVFLKVTSEKRAGLVSFVMAGDPDLEMTERVIDKLVMSGTDILEIGMPFSDPVADGAIIQAAAGRALADGVTLKQIIALVIKLRAKYAELPIILMGYFNPNHCRLTFGRARKL